VDEKLKKNKIKSSRGQIHAPKYYLQLTIASNVG